MFSARLFGGQDEVFDFLESRAERSVASVQALHGLIERGRQAGDGHQLVAACGMRRDGAEGGSAGLCGGYLSGLEGEEVEALASALDDIAGAVEKVEQHLLAGARFLRGVDLSKELVILKKATELVCLMIRQLREGMDDEEIVLRKEQLQRIQDEADKRVLEVLREVYSGNEDVLRALFLKELSERFERAVERCRDSGHVAARLVMRQG